MCRRYQKATHTLWTSCVSKIVEQIVERPLLIQWALELSQPFHTRTGAWGAKQDMVACEPFDLPS